MLRRLHHTQPDDFAFTPANQAWAEAQITKYPEGRQASAIIALLWRAQEQEGWLTRPAMEHVADMLGMAHIRAYEVASFYFMFQLQPVGSVAHIQVCGTTSCMICGAEDLIGICREKIAPNPHELSADGKFSWEEVECLGACTNAPMAQIGKDYYEDLTGARFTEILDELENFDIVLVDTAGISPYDTDRLIKTIEFLKSVRDREISTQLVVAATAKYEDIREIYEHFSFINIESVIVTKFDETNRVGDLIAFLTEKHLPVSYLSTGQRVPDDLEPAAKERILEQFLGEGEIDG